MSLGYSLDDQAIPLHSHFILKEGPHTAVHMHVGMPAEVGVHLSFLPPSGTLSFPSFPPPTSFLPS